MPDLLRVSSLLVAHDLAAARDLYSKLGFERVDTDDSGCVGFVAGSTGVILTDRDFATRCWGERATGELSGQCVPYVFLAALDDSEGEEIADTKTWFGTHERVVRTASGPMILVESD